MRDPEVATLRVAVRGALAALVGVVVSGPLGMLVVTAFHPQPPWEGAEAFALSFHPLQLLPFVAGFFLVGGYAVLIASLHVLARAEHRARTASAVVFVAAFTGLVFFNYVVQTILVPELARHYTPDKGPIIATFAMANPTSLAWGIEMTAYGLLGVATWLVAPVFCETRVERATAWLYVANGVGSVAAATWTIAEPGWVLTAPGLPAYVVWNALVPVMAIFTLVALRRRARAAVRDADHVARPAA